MIVSALMSFLTWLIKLASPTAVHAVSLALTALVKLIAAVPPEEYQKLGLALQDFLISLVTKLGTNHPAVKTLAAAPAVIADAAVALKQGGATRG